MKLRNGCLITDLPNGWPALQVRLLNELIYTARRLGDPSLAVRYDPSCANAIAEASYTVREKSGYVEVCNCGMFSWVLDKVVTIIVRRYRKI